MGRLGGTRTAVVLSTARSESLRTTIPVFVVQQMGLREGDQVEWKLDKRGGTWCAVITRRGDEE